jgi:hypothetical protein
MVAAVFVVVVAGLDAVAAAVVFVPVVVIVSGYP